MGTFTTEKSDPRLVIETKPINPTLMQRVMASVDMPRRPTYTTRTVTGRVEEWPIDERVLETNPEYKPLLDLYNEQLRRAQADSSNKSIRAMFILGCECELPTNNWERMDRMIGLDVPDDPDEKRAHYLMTHLHPEDMTGLTLAIMKETGVDETIIQEVEDSFRGALQDGPGQPGRVVDAEPDPRETAAQLVALQQELRGSDHGGRE